MGTLTLEEVAFFKEQGYCLYHRQLFAPAQLAQLHTIFEEQLAQKGAKLSDELDTPHFRDERLLAFLLSKEVLDLVEPLIGPNIALWSSHFICKDPYTGRATPWHEDSAFWEGRCSAYDQMVTVWLALDRSTRANGCMQVLPGTHLAGGFSEYVDIDPTRNTFASQIKDLDTSQAVSFELEPGECSLHDGRIMHGADANTSPYRRCGYTMRYLSTAIQVYPDKNRGHRIWLARGKDLAGNSYDVM
ncbi:MAG TPA: phytanoyl-CoA dioxygenase family protein [Ktedonobacterales bacterium]|nr:phytanoyl-CoA dioxygenase family protein [Ktedonobacterales bacterium]